MFKGTITRIFTDANGTAYSGVRVTVKLDGPDCVCVKFESDAEGSFTKESKECCIQAEVKNLSYCGLQDIALYFSTVIASEVKEITEEAYRLALKASQA